jgi:hypothetical protein
MAVQTEEKYFYALPHFWIHVCINVFLLGIICFQLVRTDIVR